MASPSDSDSENTTDLSSDYEHLHMYSGISESSGSEGEQGSYGVVAGWEYDPPGPDRGDDMGSSEGSDDAEVEDVQDRLTNLDWCICGMCVLMTTHTESTCCQEARQIRQELTQLPNIEGDQSRPVPVCITQHPGFPSVCLDPWVLRVAYKEYQQQHGNWNGNINKRNRYVAYRQLVRWCWGYLGKNIRVPLPSCAVNVIREHFPNVNPQEHYIGFQE